MSEGSQVSEGFQVCQIVFKCGRGMSGVSKGCHVCRKAVRCVSMLLCVSVGH